jgi:hypothetical protein
MASRDSTLVMLRFFPGQAISPVTQPVFRLNGTFTFDDIRPVVFDVQGSVSSKGTHGQASYAAGGTNDQPSELEQGKLFGVSRVGIGVFTKVEQDGEVSRIENILAREYKERHTRSLPTS